MFPSPSIPIQKKTSLHDIYPSHIIIKLHIVLCTLKQKEEKTMGFGSHGGGFALVVVLFILLIIVGAACFC